MRQVVAVVGVVVGGWRAGGATTGGRADSNPRGSRGSRWIWPAGGRTRGGQGGSGGEKRRRGSFVDRVPGVGDACGVMQFAHGGLQGVSVGMAARRQPARADPARAGAPAGARRAAPTQAPCCAAEGRAGAPRATRSRFGQSPARRSAQAPGVPIRVAARLLPRAHRPAHVARGSTAVRVYRPCACAQDLALAGLAARTRPTVLVPGLRACGPGSPRVSPNRKGPPAGSCRRHPAYGRCARDSTSRHGVGARPPAARAWLVPCRVAAAARQRRLRCGAGPCGALRCGAGQLAASSSCAATVSCVRVAQAWPREEPRTRSGPCAACCAPALDGCTSQAGRHVPCRGGAALTHRFTAPSPLKPLRLRRAKRGGGRINVRPSASVAATPDVMRRGRRAVAGTPVVGLLLHAGSCVSRARCKHCPPAGLSLMFSPGHSVPSAPGRTR